MESCFQSVPFQLIVMELVGCNISLLSKSQLPTNLPSVFTDSTVNNQGLIRSRWAGVAYREAMVNAGLDAGPVDGLDPKKRSNRPAFTKFKTEVEKRLVEIQSSFRQFQRCMGFAPSILFSLDCATVIKLINIFKQRGCDKEVLGVAVNKALALDMVEYQARLRNQYVIERMK